MNTNATGQNETTDLWAPTHGEGGSAPLVPPAPPSGIPEDANGFMRPRSVPADAQPSSEAVALRPGVMSHWADDVHEGIHTAQAINDLVAKTPIGSDDKGDGLAKVALDAVKKKQEVQDHVEKSDAKIDHHPETAKQEVQNHAKEAKPHDGHDRDGQPQLAHPHKVGHHAPKTDPKIEAAVAQVNAANAQMLATMQQIAAQEQARKAAEEQADKIRKALNDAKSTAIGFQLATLSRNMNDNSSRAFIQALDQIDDPDLRHKVMAQFKAQTGQDLKTFIENCDDWNNNGKNRDKAAALQLIDEKRDQAEDAIAKMSPEVRAKKEKEANDYAIQILSATTAHDHSDENMQKIFRALGPRDPVEIEMIRAAVRKHTHGESNLYQAIDDGTHKGDEDEAIAMLAGDRVGSARAAMLNETDPKRLREVLTGLKPDELAQLNQNPAFKTTALMRIANPADRAEMAALFENDKATADGEHLANLLKPKNEGRADGMEGMVDKVANENFDRRKPANVLKEFEAMSGDEVKAAAEAWNKANPGRTFEKMLEERWGGDDDKTEYNRLLAMIHGDKAMNRSLRVQEGLRENDQDEIEGALAHQTTDAKALESTDEKTRKQAEAIQAENEAFERYNVESDRTQQEATGWGEDEDAAPAVGRSTTDQLAAHYEAERVKDIGDSWEEKTYGGDFAKQIHAKRQQEHDDKVRDNRVGAEEMLAEGKLSAETEFHRGKGKKEQAETLENIQSNKELEAAQERYAAKYGKPMLPGTDKDRDDMNANELMIDNIRRYGVKAERPAQLEYLLQLQQYEKQYSKSLESDESYEAGGGTQRWQRQELAAERDMLKDPKLQAFDPKLVKDPATGMINPFHAIEDNDDEPGFNQIEKLLPQRGESDDGLKEGATKAQFNLQDKGMTAANKAQGEAKKRLAERIIKILSTIAKIAAALTAQPELIALIDIGEGLLEMAVKHQVMGEAYDPAEDVKMLAFTAAADVALMGLSKVGQVRGAAAMAEQKAISAGEKTAMEMEHAVSGEAKAQALAEGAHVAAGENKLMQGAIKEGTSAEKALSAEAASVVGSKVEQKAASIAEGKALHEGESLAAREVASEVEHAGASAATKELNPAELAKKIEARWGLYGAGAKMAIQTVGGGIVQGKSPSEILRGLVTGGLGLVLPGHLTERVRAAIGNDTAALKILGELASTGTDFVTNTAINAASGADGGDAALDALIGVGGARVQRAFHGGGHAAANKEQAPTHESGSEPVSASPHVEPVVAGPHVEPQHAPLIGGAERGSPNIDLRGGATEHRRAANAETPASTSHEETTTPHGDETIRTTHGPKTAEGPVKLTGMGETRGADPEAGRMYDEIRTNKEDVKGVAKTMGVDPATAERIKAHLFENEHEIPTVEGMKRERFEPVKEYAELWKAAEAGTLNEDQRKVLTDLMTHENVEATLHAQGVPVYDPNLGFDEGGYPTHTMGDPGAHSKAVVAERGFLDRDVHKMTPEQRQTMLRPMMEASLQVRSFSPEELSAMHPEARAIYDQIQAERAAARAQMTMASNEGGDEPPHAGTSVEQTESSTAGKTAVAETTATPETVPEGTESKILTSDQKAQARAQAEVERQKLEAQRQAEQDFAAHEDKVRINEAPGMVEKAWRGKVDLGAERTRVQAEGEQKYRDTFRERYFEAREGGATDAEAKKTARRAADKAVIEHIQDEGAKIAQQRARTDLVTDSNNDGVPDAFGMVDPTVQKDFADFQSGARGTTGKELAPELKGKTPAEMEALLVLKGGVKTTSTVKEGKIEYPQTEYTFDDGTLVRIKPNGDGGRNTTDAMYSVEVLKGGPDPRATDPQDKVAFKLDVTGTPVPKGLDDAARRYPGKGQVQQKAYENELIRLGHLKAGEEDGD